MDIFYNLHGEEYVTAHKKGIKGTPHRVLQPIGRIATVMVRLYDNGSATRLITYRNPKDPNDPTGVREAVLTQRMDEIGKTRARINKQRAEDGLEPIVRVANKFSEKYVKRVYNQLTGKSLDKVKGIGQQFGFSTRENVELTEFEKHLLEKAEKRASTLETV